MLFVGLARTDTIVEYFFLGLRNAIQFPAEANCSLSPYIVSCSTRFGFRSKPFNGSEFCINR